MSAAGNTQPRRLGMATPSSVLRMLFEHAEGSLSQQELEHLATAGERVQALARTAAAVANDLGGAVATENAAGSGHLFSLFGAVFEQIDNLAFIAAEANALCRRPDLAASPKGGAR